MKISGSYIMKAPRQAVWDRLIGPQAIARCLPGVEKLNQVSQEEYEMVMTVGIGPVTATYEGKVQLTNMRLVLSLHRPASGTCQHFPGAF